ncbi:uncharacterized protein (DUF2062 family), partial [Paenibacillus baekrokdamisoli]
YAVDASGNVSAATADITLTNPDITAPTLSGVETSVVTPNTLAATSNENGTLYLVLKSATITNQASLDAEVSGSRGTSVAATAASAAAIPTTGLTAGTYVVYAVDASGNVSAASADVTLTNPDITAPTLSGVETSVVTPNTLAATSNENGTLYLVLKSATITNQASLDAEVSGSRGTSVAATAASAAAIPTTGLTAGTYVVYAVDASGNVSAATADITLTNPDITAPTLSGVETSVVTPNTLAATSNENGTLYLVLKSATITNQASLDAEVSGSRGTSVAATAASAAAIPTTGLTAGTYVVYAVDASGNVSAATADVTLTNPDITAPTLSGVGTSVLTPNTLAATSNENGTLYLVLKSATITNKASLDAEVSSSRGTSVAATAASAAAIPTTGLTAGTYVVYAVDAAGNVSTKSADVTLTNPDITAPTLSGVGTNVLTPNTLAATSNENGTLYLVLKSATITNKASLDAEVSSSRGTSVAATAASAAAIPTTGLTAGTYVVYAVDAAGNVSTKSADVTLTNPDITAPTLSGVGTSVLTPNTLAATSNENGTLYLVLKSATITNKASLDAEVSSSRGTSVAATAASAAEIPTTGLTAGTYVVYAVDAAGNVSTKSADVTLTNPDITAPTLILTSASATANSTTTLNFVSDETGTYYFVVYAAADAAPNAATIAAQGIAIAKGTGAAAAAANMASVTGLSASTHYKAYVIIKDAAGNASGVATISLTTTATPSNGSTPLPDTETEILINGKAEKAGTTTTTQVNGQTVTTVVINSKKLEEKIASEGEHAAITISVNTKSDVVTVEFDG